MLRKLVYAVLAAWLACAPGAPAFAQASADQLNKLSLESLTANPGGSGGGYSSRSYRPARRAYAVRRYRTARRFARYQTPRSRYRPVYAARRYHYRPVHYYGRVVHRAYHRPHPSYRRYR